MQLQERFCLSYQYNVYFVNISVKFATLTLPEGYLEPNVILPAMTLIDCTSGSLSAETPTQNHFKVWKLKFKGCFFHMLCVPEQPQPQSQMWGQQRRKGEQPFSPPPTGHVTGTNITLSGANVEGEQRKRVFIASCFWEIHICLTSLAAN